MKSHIVTTLIACVIWAATVHGQSSGDTNKPAAVPAPSMGLKDAYAGKFLIGAAGDIPRGYSEAELANIKANYNVITPENCMKPQPTHPSEDTYNFTTPDALVKWSGENNIKVWGHTLVWHAQTRSVRESHNYQHWSALALLLNRMNDSSMDQLGMLV